MKQFLFDHTDAGKEIHGYTMEAGRFTATVLDFGGILQKFTVDGLDIVCGFDDYHGYDKGEGCHGALIGRYANRICGGRFVLNGKTYQLEKNEKGVTHLHGGSTGFRRSFWQVTPRSADGFESLSLTYHSPDGEAHYPGNLDVTVTYTLTEQGLCIRYEADSDADTILNMTNHAYFNLDGYASGSILHHTLQIPADTFDAVNDQLIPVAEQSVTSTPFDFRNAKEIGKDIGASDAQLKLGNGYDHNFILNANAPRKQIFGTNLTEAAILSNGKRKLTCYTNKPCIQIYTANFMTNPIPLKGGVAQQKNGGVCLETQFAPDSPNHGGAILRRGDHYCYTTAFAVEDL